MNHLQRSKIIAEREKLCKNVEPDLFHILLNVKVDLLFNRQLRIHRSNIAFKKCLEEVTKEVGGAITEVWTSALGLTEHSHLAEIVLNLSLENLYLKITEETLI